MIRLLFIVLGFVLLALVQSAFVTSLPRPFSLAPLVLALSIYLIQHHGWLPAAAWAVLYGLVLDLAGIGQAPLEVFAYAAAAMAAILTSRRLFTNRSVYGILACGLVCAVVLGAVHLATWSIVSLRDPAVAWGSILSGFGWSSLFLLVLLAAFFPFAGLIRRTLIHSFLMPQTRQTL